MKPERIVVYNTKEEPSRAFDKIMAGVNLLADPVKQTLGPYGRNFMLEKGLKITNDGVSIAKEIQAKDEVEDLALRIAREATVKTNEDAGDGTTTATTFVQAILKECAQYIGRIGARSVISMKQEIERDIPIVIEKLRAMATKIKSEEQLTEAVMVSVEDRELATLIAKAQWDLGADGHIVVEENTDPVCLIEKIQGVRIDNGLGTSMVMNDLERQRLALENVPVLLTNHVLKSLAPITPVLEDIYKQGRREIVLVCRAYTNEVLQHMMENAKKGGIRIYPLNAPYVNQREVMKDLQSILGGRYIHDEASPLESVQPHDLGTASNVVGYRYSATFTGTRDCSDRVAEIKKEIKGEASKFQKKMLEQRLSQLTNGFALLKIGSLSDVDRKYKFDKAEDACNTARSALQEGTVPGAGQAFKMIAEELPEDSLLKKPLMAPYLQIMENAGGEFTVEPWVRNSLKVDRVAFENAAKVASDILTTCGAIVTEKQKPIDHLIRHASAQPEQQEG